MLLLLLQQKNPFYLWSWLHITSFLKDFNLWLPSHRSVTVFASLSLLHYFISIQMSSIVSHLKNKTLPWSLTCVFLNILYSNTCRMNYLHSYSLLPYFTISPQHISIKLVPSISMKFLFSSSPTPSLLPYPKHNFLFSHLSSRRLK